MISAKTCRHRADQRSVHHAARRCPWRRSPTIKTVLGPQEIKGERGLLVGYVTMNTRDRDEVSVVEDAEALLQQAVRDGRLALPPGYYWEWSGQFENQVRAMARMRILVPICSASCS